MGPKTEFHRIENAPVIKLASHLDAGAGFYMGKRLSDNVSLELGFLKNDYSTKFNIETVSADGEKVEIYEDFIYPTLTSYQLGFLGNYRQPLSEKWTGYGNFGLHIFISKNLSNLGSTSTYYDRLRKDNVVIEEFSLTTFKNTEGPANLIFRGDIGLYRNLNENLALDFNFSARASNLSLYSYNLDLTSNRGASQKNMKVNNQGVSLGFNLGVKYMVNSLETKKIEPSPIKTY